MTDRLTTRDVVRITRLDRPDKRAAEIALAIGASAPRAKHRGRRGAGRRWMLRDALSLAVLTHLRVNGEWELEELRPVVGALQEMTRAELADVRGLVWQETPGVTGSCWLNLRVPSDAAAYKKYRAQHGHQLVELPLGPVVEHVLATLVSRMTPEEVAQLHQELEAVEARGRRHRRAD